VDIGSTEERASIRLSCNGSPTLLRSKETEENRHQN
jgi:hypothetical protein